jgi:ACT domain-containing protein
MDDLIRRKATGTPIEFAKKMGLSRSMLFKYLEIIKELDGPVHYSHQFQSYYYSEQVELNLGYKRVS